MGRRAWWLGLLPPVGAVTSLPAAAHRRQLIQPRQPGPAPAPERGSGGARARHDVAATWEVASLIGAQALVQDPLGSQADGALLRSVLATKFDATFRGVCAQSFCVVAVAELFDKTWFVTLLCSLSHGPRVSFAASFLALALHTVLAACLGAVISKFFALWLLHTVTASVFFLFAGFYAYECYTADPEEDALKTRTEDAKEALGVPDVNQKDFGLTSGRFFPVFLAVFIAEWGDRTQVSMITLHSSLPVVPVCLGSLVAFLVLSASAALVAQLLEGRRLSERLISGVSAASFLAFGLLAAAEAVQASRSQAV